MEDYKTKIPEEASLDTLKEEIEIKKKELFELIDDAKDTLSLKEEKTIEQRLCDIDTKLSSIEVLLSVISNKIKESSWFDFWKERVVASGPQIYYKNNEHQ